MLNVITIPVYDENGKEKEENILVSTYNMVNRARSFTMIDEYGIETEYHVLFSFDSSESGKNYIVYTDNSVDDEGNTEIYASILNSDSNGEFLSSIETEEEWRVIEVILEELKRGTLM